MAKHFFRPQNQSSSKSNRFIKSIYFFRKSEDTDSFARITGINLKDEEEKFKKFG